MMNPLSNPVMQLEALAKKQSGDKEINWVTGLFMGLFHAGAVVALFFFTWKALVVAVLLWWISGSLGIGMGYHRLLTHRGYKTPKWVEYCLTVCATLALEGGPIFWVATHRIHHSSPIRMEIHILRGMVSGGRTWDGSSRASPCIMTRRPSPATSPTSPKTSFTSGSRSTTMPR